MIRGFEEQFEEDTVKKIQDLLRRIEAIKLPFRVSKFFVVDLSICLKAGALLGALQLAASLLELTVREMVMVLSSEALSENNRKRNLQKELEDKKHFGFNHLVTELEKVDLFDRKDAELARQFYNTVRIPLHHGLTRRFITEHDNNNSFKLFEEVFGGAYQISMHDFERVIEQEALSLIETAIGIIERNQK